MCRLCVAAVLCAGMGARDRAAGLLCVGLHPIVGMGGRGRTEFPAPFPDEASFFAFFFFA